MTIDANRIETEIVSDSFVAAHPELHHYTRLEGLQGIVQTNTMWAFHYRDLNDSTEVFHLKDALIEELAPRFKAIAAENSSWQWDWNKRKKIEPEDGPRKVAQTLIGHLFGDLFVAKGITFSEAFVASFCSHATDSPYESRNGLLSQWRGYGSGGGFCIVFDTDKLAGALRRERAAQFYTYCSLKKVHYAEGDTMLRDNFPELIGVCENFFTAWLTDGGQGRTGYGFTEFVSAATRFKHRGFKEEREARIVAVIGSDNFSRQRSRDVRKSGMRRYISLLEGLGVTLPIKRVIVGPSHDQSRNVEHARALLGPTIEVHPSETPFVEPSPEDTKGRL